MGLNSRMKREEGAAMLEMVIVLPLLMLLLFGILEMGLAFARFQVVSNAAREGAREASLFRINCNAGTVTGEVNTVIARYGTQYGMTPGSLSTTVTGACSAGESTVRVTYTNSFIALPSIGGIPNSVNLVGESVMRNEV